MDRHRKLVSNSSLFWCDPKWCHKGREINLRFVTITKANLECSIIYKMAVSLDTNTRPQEKQSKEHQDVPPQSQKCFQSRQELLHFWADVQQRWETHNFKGELMLLKRMTVNTDNSAMMASGHFYESVCVANYQSHWPPTLDGFKLRGTKLNGVTSTLVYCCCFFFI